MSQFDHDFNALLDARFPILVSETYEESRFLACVREICTARDMPLFLWSLADGLKRSTESSAVYNTNDFTDALKHVDVTPQNGLYVFLDAHPFFDTPLNTRLVREIAFEHYRRDRTLLFVSPSLNLPPRTCPHVGTHFDARYFSRSRPQSAERGAGSLAARYAT